MNKKKKILIGVAWPYVNGELHVGHLSYLLPCDIYARFNRLKGHDVLMVSGSDCHGTPITVEADKRGITALEIVNEYDPKLRKLISSYKITYDLFTKTVAENHKQVTQEFFLNLLKNGFISKQKSLQYFSPEENKFLPDRYVEGECPHCHAQDQRSDQCEICGRSLGEGELINPKSKLSKKSVEFKETEHYFIRYDLLQKEIEHFVQLKNSDESKKWREWVLKETEGFLKEGLKPRAITRDLDWGVEIPADQIPPENILEGYENKRFYVWFDAVIGYYSATVEYFKKPGLNDEEVNKKVDEYWSNPEAYHTYFMGKDNLTFHTIFWPGQLIGQGKNLNLPDFPAINHFINLEGKKFSKSRGIVVDAQKAVEAFGLDPVRFYVAAISPENSDANWKWDDFIATNNNELLANIGNFVHRTLTFFQNKLDLKIKNENSTLDENKIDFSAIVKSNPRSDDSRVSDFKLSMKEALIGSSDFDGYFKIVNDALEKCEFKKAILSILNLVKFGNKYFDLLAPWQSIKTNPEDCEKTIYNCLQIVNAIRVLIHPFLPDASDKLSEMLGLEKLPSLPGVNTEAKDYFAFDAKEIDSVIKSGLIGKNTEIKPLFRKMEVEETEKFLI